MLLPVRPLRPLTHCILSQPNCPYPPLLEHNEKTVKTLGAGPPSLPPVRGILGILLKKGASSSMPFTKVLKQSKPKHFDAIEPPYSTVDDCRTTVLPLDGVGEDNGSKVEAELAQDDQVDTVEVRGILLVYWP